MSKTKNHWPIYVIIHVLFIGVWGAVIEIPEKNGFPPTLGYVVWALTMIPAALAALKLKNWKLDFNKKAVLWGSAVGLLGAGGQLVLFFTLRIAPAYLVFPILSLTPVVTILLAVGLLHEKTSKRGWIGIALALISIFMLSYQPVGAVQASGYTWLLLAAVPLFAWGAQGCIMRFANDIMSAESLYFYMMVSSIVLIPPALYMTDFTQPIEWGFQGPYLSAILQSLNAFGALCLVYAFRYGKAIIIAPITTALAPVLTVTLSLALYQTIPHPVIIAGIVLTIIAALLMGFEEASNA
ncbi:DMT family transporter [Dyadobacter fanqingshengii]|uniref:DMT family transporter n=1 Tax=Dyadobacter fanqingshengii TaxID=2906443 RepID=A0A9X1PDS4_9BACT|nr:DMT family transporter [Dyadobacter fanqingshengii]MCF0041397.1 DMT family transporter [Dyadobacter fanqingshengii]MCF2505497.1 DMT family transporter [Dyadobacter fanqingshengii]USJ36882.1 DMT family transporter [Dyadobacter fanqingshengii]